MRRPHLEPACVPEYGQVSLTYIAAIGYLACCRKQHFPSIAQHVDGYGIEGVADMYVES